MKVDNSNGVLGEEYACRYLEKNVAKVLFRNFSCRWGEIDIIARKGRYLLFVEVKTRSSNMIAVPQAAVTATKQRRILRTAMWFLKTHPTELQPRFDVIALTMDRYTDSVLNCNYIENAFGAEGGGYAPF